MTKLLLVSAASLALVATAGAANAQTIGHIGANYQRTNLDTGLGDADVNTAEVEGAVRFNLGSLGAQVDGAVTRFDVEDFAGSQTATEGTFHLNTKLGGALVGGFVGFQNADDVSMWSIGGEGQANLTDSLVAYGQAGYGKSNEIDTDFWAVRGELRYFVNDNFKVQGSLGGTWGDTNAGNFDAWTAGVDGEYQFANTNWSVVGGYEHSEISDVDLDSDTFRIGLRYNFGGSLRERDQSGASLAPASKLFAGTLGKSLISVLGGL